MRNKTNKAIILCITICLVFTLTSCSTTNNSVRAEISTPTEALRQLISGNEAYIREEQNNGNITSAIREDTAENGQNPYAVVITCSDSRVPPEHIFSAGIGDLFVIRTAGNVIGDYELGSIEYGVEHLGIKLIIVMGHSSCGAVSAAAEGDASGHLEDIVKEIQSRIGDEKDVSIAENLNIAHSKEHIMESITVQELVAQGELAVVETKYNIYTGEVEILDAGEIDL